MPIVIDIDPVAKPRMTQKDKWAKRDCVMNYWSYCDKLRKQTSRKNFVLSGNYHIDFYLPMPKSWSKKRKQMMKGQPHLQRPDLDNLIKGINDTLLKEDKIVYQFLAGKWWGEDGKIIIQNFDK